MSKVSFRVRQIDFNKSIPIYKYDSELPFDINDGSLNRAANSVPSGMEREEENEHHLIEVLQAHQMQKSELVCIPVPDIIDKSEDYTKMYANNFELPKNLVRLSIVDLEDEEKVDYDMDSDDEEWLKRSGLSLSPEAFESMIDRLERGCGQDVLSLDEARLLLNEHDATVIVVYEYWLQKRLKFRRPLLNFIRQDKRDAGSNNDPYVAFRRRTERMQTRKNRKNEEYSYEKMLILKRQFSTLCEVLSDIMHREMTKEALIEVERQAFQARFRMGDWDGNMIGEAEAIAQKYPGSVESSVSLNAERRISALKRKINGVVSKDASGESSDNSDAETRHGNAFPFVRRPGCKYLKPGSLKNESETNSQSAFILSRVRLLQRRLTRSNVRYFRRRYGRNGRLQIDQRLSTGPLGSYLKLFETPMKSGPEVLTTELRRFAPLSTDGSSRLQLTPLSTAPSSIPSLSNRSEDILENLKSLLQDLPKDRLEHGLSMLAGGRRTNVSDLPVIRDDRICRVHALSCNVQRVSDSPALLSSIPPSVCGSSLIRRSAIGCVAEKTRGHIRDAGNCDLGHVPPTLGAGGDNATTAAPMKGGRTCSLPQSGGFTTNGKSNSLPGAKKTQFLNGSATTLNGDEDGGFQLLPQVRRSPGTLKKSTSHDDAAVPASVDEKSIIHPVAYNV